MIVIGVDPGNMTGLATIQITAEGTRCDWYQMNNFHALSWLEDYAAVNQEIMVACERYTIGRTTHKLTQQPVAMQMIGAIQRFVDKFSHMELVMQSPGPAKRMSTTEFLKSQNIPIPASDDHARMAMGHAIFALLTKKPLLFARFVQTGTVIPTDEEKR